MQFISASIALETILAYSEADQFILDGKTFKKLRKSLAKEINDNLQEQVPKEDILSIVGSLSQLNRRHYKNKVIELLQSLGIFDTGIEKKLSNIIKVRNKITHTGKFKDLSSKDKSVVEAYFELFNILSKIFFRLLVNDLEIYKKEFHDMEWQQLK
jgi:hypothetical protein